MFQHASTHSRLCLLLLLGDVCGRALPLQLQLSERHRDRQQSPAGIHIGGICDDSVSMKEIPLVLTTPAIEMLLFFPPTAELITFI